MEKILYLPNEAHSGVVERRREPTDSDQEYIYAYSYEEDSVVLQYQYLDRYGSIRITQERIQSNSGYGLFSLIEVLSEAVEHTSLKMDPLFSAYLIAESLHIRLSF